MELFSFDFRSWVITVLLFFSGCMAYRPPEPVTVPKVTIKKLTVASDELSLTISFDKKGSLYISQNPAEKTTRSKKIATKELDQAIKKAKQEANDQDKKLKVILKCPNNLSEQKFHLLITALKGNGIYNFQLLTTPD